MVSIVIPGPLCSLLLVHMASAQEETADEATCDASKGSCEASDVETRRLEVITLELGGQVFSRKRHVHPRNNGRLETKPWNWTYPIRTKCKHENG